MRIHRNPMYHQGTFERILRNARLMQRFHKINGTYWELVYDQEGVQIFYQAPFDLKWLQERVEDYERFFYSSLAGGYCAKDGALRHRTHNVTRGAGGAFRQKSL